jgi:hypothetical protein
VVHPRALLVSSGLCVGRLGGGGGRQGERALLKEKFQPPPVAAFSFTNLCLRFEPSLLICLTAQAAVAVAATAALVPAAEKGDLATVEDCVAKGADVDVTGRVSGLS